MSDTILDKALADRELHPWRYYKLDFDTLQRMAEELVSQREALRQQVATLTAEREQLLDCVGETRRRLADIQADFAHKQQQVELVLAQAQKRLDELTEARTIADRYREAVKDRDKQLVEVRAELARVKSLRVAGSFGLIPMSDIVTLLREEASRDETEGGFGYELMTQAASQIEELRADVATMTAERDGWKVVADSERHTVAAQERTLAAMASELIAVNHVLGALKARVLTWRESALQYRNECSRRGNHAAFDVADSEYRAYDAVLALLSAPEVK